MPLTHDMGLIGFHLIPLIAGAKQYILNTRMFLENPSIWINSMSEYKVTISAAPNYAFKYIIGFSSNISENCDLSSMRCIFNGGEPIDSEICYTFLERMKAYNLKNNVIVPTYGLAEACLVISFNTLYSELDVEHVKKRIFKIVILI